MTLEEIQGYCRSLPGTTEDLKWGSNLVFSVGGKMYAVLSLDDQPTPRLSLKASPEEAAALVHHADVIPAPYLAKHHWVTFLHLNVLPKSQLQTLLTSAYTLVFSKLTKKLQASLKASNPS